MSPFKLKSLLTVAIVLSCCLQVSNALMCYDCNSEYDRRCGDPFDPYSIGVVNCSKQEPLEHLKDKYKPILCRKTTQKVYGKVRIVRGCGYIPDERTDDGECLKRSGTHDVQALYCACTNDLCNHASSLFSNYNINYNNNNIIINKLKHLIQIISYAFAAIFLIHFNNFNTFTAIISTINTVAIYFMHIS